MEQHRPGKNKQRNKPHKCPKKRIRHNSNGSYSKIKIKSSSSINQLHFGKKGSKIARKNQQAQLRKLKRENLLNSRRSIDIEPILISIIDYSNNAEHLIDLMHKFDKSSIIESSSNGQFILLEIPKIFARYQITFLNQNDLFSSIDLTRISDILLIIFSPEIDLNSNNFDSLEAIYNFSLPHTIVGLTGFDKMDISKQKDLKRSILDNMALRFPGMLNITNKVPTLDTAQDLAKFFSDYSSIKYSSSGNFCSKRSQLLAENFNFIPSENYCDLGILQVDGFVRNKPMDINSLIYIPEFGEFNIDSIKSIPIPYGDEKRKNRKNFEIIADKSLRESIVKENPVQIIDEEMVMAEEEEETKIVPKGTSDYQAAWIVESDEENTSENDMVKDYADADKIKKVNFDLNIEENESDIGMDIVGEQDLSKKTEIDVPARERFAEFRGLKSFRTSEWDCKENLPPDYSRIFKFKNYEHTRKRILNSESINGIDSGNYVRLELANVPKKLAEYFWINRDKPLILFQLLKYEHQMSVMNTVLRKVSSYDKLVRSNETLIFHVGYRRFKVKPIFSAHTNENKFKYEKYLLDMPCVATFYAPITFAPAPVLVYKEFADGTCRDLVAVGTLLNCSPDRLVIKRCVLSGYPYKINGKQVVVREMFNNREDIIWFRPVELITSKNRHGHILEPVGSHGHMKCRFDHTISSMETIMMFLYKRVFPTWSYKPLMKSMGENENENEDDDYPLDSD